ncbi:hypothetical protein GE061_010069 [Apolygus lucorum]|uniref:Peptidase S1 domain-containing protein n=1 Tax=Apolygus lucorum TaxID=248454 RepID=A0A8S9Y278_APOLU|nr:hypothetical protein GE061_010069 [Apolygus lucorum]
MEKLEKMKSMGENGLIGLDEMAARVDNAVTTVVLIGRAEYLYDPVILNSPVSKLNIFLKLLGEYVGRLGDGPWLLLVAVVAYASADSSEDGVSPRARELLQMRLGQQGQWFQNYRRVVNTISPVEAQSSLQTTFITAAHCLSKIIKFRLKAAVFLGAHDLREVKTTAVFVYVAHFQQHAGYIPNKSDDIAILTLASSINFNKIIGPVCMPHPGLDVSGKTVRVLGWGAERSKGKGTNIPKKLDTTAMSSEKCNSAWGPNHTNPTHICTYSWKENVCQGDSGGPVVWLDPQTNRYILVGLVSHGLMSCSGWKPSIHTRVASYLPWIHQQIAMTKPSTMCIKAQTEIPVSYPNRTEFPSKISSVKQQQAITQFLTKMSYTSILIQNFPPDPLVKRLQVAEVQHPPRKTTPGRQETTYYRSTQHPFESLYAKNLTSFSYRRR